jgi:TRAP-type C4-dicarboxylate transport system substrate-binding protein
MKKKIILAAIIGALGIAAAGPAAARELKFNMFQPPRTLEAKVYDDFFAELAKATNGSLTTKVFAGGQLLNGPGTLKGIKDGVVDGGFVVPSLNLGELKHIAMVPDMLPWVTNSQVAAAAGLETILIDCAECKQEQKNLNVVFLGGHGPTSWNLMCAKPVSNLADFKGRKVRVTGSSATRMIRALGGVAVLLPPPEIASALSGGQIDCAVGPNAWLADYSLWDSVKQVIDLDLGVYHGLGLFVTNAKTLASFTPQERKAYVGLMAKYGVIATDRYVEQQREVRETAAKRGIQFFKPGKDFTDALAKFRAEDLPRLAEDFKARGVADPDKLMKQHLAAIDKWTKIVEKTGGDRPALIKAINDEIYNKLGL